MELAAGTVPAEEVSAALVALAEDTEDMVDSHPNSAPAPVAAFAEAIEKETKNLAVAAVVEESSRAPGLDIEDIAAAAAAAAVEVAA